jgi:hypothetical protein
MFPSMVMPATGHSGAQQPTRSYSRIIRTALFLGAFAVALLPLPVAALGLLPVYRVHARFLMFYSPVVCLLILAYLFYVRDSLARLMFANILNPLSEPDRYYRAPVGLTLRRTGRSLRTAVLAVLPAVLLATSFYCALRYTTRLNDSVDLATATWAGQSAVESGFVADKQRGKSTVPRVRAPRRAQDSIQVSSKITADDSGTGSETLTVREQVLRTAGIDRIPLFTELTILYIAIFAAALIGLILMALKEYAKDAMGLSEEDLVLGGLSLDAGPAGEASTTAPPRI